MRSVEAADAVDLVRPEHLLRAQIETPVPDFGHLLGHRHQPICFSEFRCGDRKLLFGLVAPGNVDDRSHDVPSGRRRYGIEHDLDRNSAAVESATRQLAQTGHRAGRRFVRERFAEGVWYKNVHRSTSKRPPGG
jgi:hypothetical protein